MENNIEGLEIFDSQGMAVAIRETQYQNIMSAIAEIVDNSIEAKAQDILIITREDVDKTGGLIVKDIAILDNGTGMDIETLQNCLVFGKSTKTPGYGVMGKFGVGLGQASLFSAPRVEVMSWIDEISKKMVYLDVNEMRSGVQRKIYRPVDCEIPDVYRGFLRISLPNIETMSFQHSGTLVLWKNVDKVTTRPSTFYKNLQIDLGRRFRYYIERGNRIVITTTAHNPLYNVKAVDPMFLMENSKYTASSRRIGYLAQEDEIGEPIFEPFICDLTPNGTRKIEFQLEENDRLLLAELTLKCSVVKEKFYWPNIANLKVMNPGNTEIGDCAKKLEGISIVRSSREIQNDKFGLYSNTNQPENRWWHLEISFNPDLDRFFKLSNNKQKVEIMSDFMSTKKGETDYYASEMDLEIKAWRKILTDIEKLIKLMQKRNDALSKGGREAQNRGKPPTIDNNPYVDSKHINKGEIHPNKNDENPILEILNEVVQTDTKKLRSNNFFEIRKNDYGVDCIINEDNVLFRRLEDNEQLLLGMKIMLTAIKETRLDFTSYSDIRSYEVFVNSLNEKLGTIALQLEDEND